MTKAIIDGKRYDTETATEIAYTEFSTRSDFKWCMETLYRTPRGNWFLHGEGNASSKYAKRVDTSSYSGGSSIIPLKPEEAREWLENANTVRAIAALETYFNEDIEDA